MHAPMRRVLLKGIAASCCLRRSRRQVGYVYLRQSLPLIDGTATVAGLSAPIDIVRDADAIPHIFAANKLDALFGLGYVHAQDRLWQMEFQRRIGHGRLSEVLRRRDAARRIASCAPSASAAPHARRGPSTPDWAKQQVNAYVAGVNAFIATHHGAGLPPEFTLLRFEPEPWSRRRRRRLGEDDGVGSERELLVRAAAPRPGRDGRRGAHGAADAAVSGRRPEHPARTLNGHPAPCPRSSEQRAARAGIELHAAAAASRGARRRPVRAATRRPRLSARRRHDRGARLEQLGRRRHADRQRQAAPRQRSASGHAACRPRGTSHTSPPATSTSSARTLPGTPAVALGRNRFIAWGATNVAADVQDLYREHLDAAGTHDEFRGAHEPITMIPETIIVKGAAPVTRRACA